jgi:hypothetical protein
MIKTCVKHCQIYNAHLKTDSVLTDNINKTVLCLAVFAISKLFGSIKYDIKNIKTALQNLKIWKCLAHVLINHFITNTM